MSSDLGANEVEFLAKTEVSSSGFRSPSVEGLTAAVEDVRYKLTRLAQLNEAQVGDVTWTLVAVARGRKTGAVEGA